MALPRFLTAEHPIYCRNKAMWEMNERRMRGGMEIWDELRPFDWETLPDEAPIGVPRRSETDEEDVAAYFANLRAAANIKPGDHYRFRQEMCTYLNFPEMFATAMVGHLMGRAPVPGSDLNFGRLGKVGRTRDRNNPTDAELIYFNADTIGNEGSGWDNYWGGVMRRAMATGHRWMLVDAPRKAPLDRQTLIRFNLRPYLTDFSPLCVPMWDYVDKVLGMIQIVVPSRRLELGGELGDELIGNEGCDDILLMTRRGYLGLGPEFADGGWWLLDQDGDIITEGNWNKTGGEIPVFPVYYQRDVPTRTADGKYFNSMSKPGITEIGNAAISYMNISSAADFDAWDAAASIQFLRGVDEEGWKLAMKILQAGSRYVPLEGVQDAEGRGTPPMIQDASMGAVVASVFDMALKRKMDEVARLAATQATQAPDSSGLSKHAGFSEAKVPRLALMASEIESAQNTALYFLERRWGKRQPSAQVVWTRKFNLVELSEDIESYFNLEVLSGLRSSTIGSKAMIAAAREKGLITDDADAATALKEYTEAAKQAEALAKAKAQGTSPSTSSGQGLSGAEPAAREILDPAA